MAWRRTHEDAGMGCAPVPPNQLSRIEEPKTPKSFTRSSRKSSSPDRRTKEEVPS